jgi:hypothetical protein
MVNDRLFSYFVVSMANAHEGLLKGSGEIMACGKALYWMETAY